MQYPLGQYFALLSDGDASFILWIVATIQTIIVLVGAFRTVVAFRWYRWMMIGALLLLPIVLGIGTYFALQPVA